MPPKPKITLANVRKNFGTKTVLKKINLNIYPNESLVIIGTSGCGKSVLLKTIIGLLDISEGTIQLDDKNIHHLTAAERTEQGMNVGMLFQYAALFDSLTVRQNVAFGLQHGKHKITPTDIKNIADEKIAEVGLQPEIVANLYPAELSGGMKKRVGLARALATSPDILFFDEPTTGLDPIMGHVIDGLINNSVKKHKATAITITHDLASAKRIGDRCAMIHDGVVAWQGKIKELDKTDNPYVKQFREGDIKGPIKLPVKKP